MHRLAMTTTGPVVCHKRRRWQHTNGSHPCHKPTALNVFAVDSDGCNMGPTGILTAMIVAAPVRVAAMNVLVRNCLSLFARVVEFRQAPVYKPQLPLFMIDHDLSWPVNRQTVHRVCDVDDYMTLPRIEYPKS